MNLEDLRIALPVLWPSALIALGFALLAWWPLRNAAKKHEPLFGARWPMTLAVGAAFMVSLLVILKGWPGLQPKQSWQWLLHIAAAATLAGILASFFTSFAWRFVIALVLACFVVFLFHAPRVIENPLTWKIGVAAASFVLWLALEPIAHRRAGLSLPLCMLVLFGGASLLLKESRSANLSLAAASCSAAWGSIALVAVFNSHVSVSRGPILVVAALWPALLALGEFDRRGGVPPTSFVILAIAPFTLLLAELPLFAKFKVWQLAILRAALVAIPVAVAIGMAMRASQGESEYGY